MLEQLIKRFFELIPKQGVTLILHVDNGSVNVYCPKEDSVKAMELAQTVLPKVQELWPNK